MLKIIALATVLLALFAIAPALADTTYYADPAILNDESGLQIHITSIVLKDYPLGSYVFTYPPEQYHYYDVYYTKYNPTDHDIRYLFNLVFVDENGTEYYTEDFILGIGIGPGIHANEVKEFPVLRNVTGLHMRWRHMDRYINDYVWDNINLTTQQTDTPTPTSAASPTATATATPTQAASPTATATAKPAPTGGLLPLLAIGLVACGFVLARIVKK